MNNEVDACAFCSPQNIGLFLQRIREMCRENCPTFYKQSGENHCDFNIHCDFEFCCDILSRQGKLGAGKKKKKAPGKKGK